jgi:autotransporter-associated beta strand protein
MKNQYFCLAVSLVAWCAAAPLQAANDVWTGGGANANWQTAANWAANTAPSAGDSLFFGGTTQLTASNNYTAATSFAGLTFPANAGAFTLLGNSLTATAGVTNYSPNTETINLPLAFAATRAFNSVSGGTLLVGGVISGAGGVATAGSGAVSFTTNNSYTGSTAVNNGTLTLDFTGGAANNIVSSNSALSLGGGTLQINGSSSAASSQTFGSTAVSSGASIVSASASGSSLPTVALKAITPSAGASVVFNGPATINGSGAVAATAALTTTTEGSTTAGAYGVLIGGANNNAYATVGLYDWASTYNSAGAAGASPYPILGGSQVAGFYTVVGNNSNPGNTYSNLDFTTQQVPAAGGTDNVRFAYTGTSTAETIRYNSGNAPYAAVKGNDFLNVGGILITPNMGSVNAALDGLRLQGTACQIVQNNTAAVFILGVNSGGGPFFSNSSSTTEAVVKSGPGSWFIAPTVDNLPMNYLDASGTLTTASTTAYNYVNGPSSTWGAFYFNGGVSVFNNPNVFGMPTTLSTTAGGGGTINLNGGTLMSHNNNVTLNITNISGAPGRYVFLGSSGGGLAADTNTTLTVSGLVSGSGALTIGIPASAANGGVAGLVPGTGGSTANNAVNAVGTVYLSDTANAYSGGTVLASGTLQFTNGSLGSGGVTFNGGTLRWSTNTATDISTQLVTVASGGGALDLGANAVRFTNSIGNYGSGALIVYSSTGTGSLNLRGANTYTGGTIISNCTLQVNNTNGSATGSGNVTVLSGTFGGNGSVSGLVEITGGAVLYPGTNGVGTNSVGSLQMDSGSIFNVGFVGTVNDQEVVTGSYGLTINGGTVNLYQAGSTTPFATPGTYNLIQFTDGINGGVGNFTVGNPQTGYIYTFGTSGNYVTLQISISSSVDIGTWSVNANGNWSSSANWTAVAGTMPPHNPGDAATLGVGTGLRTVTLDANEAVGGLTLTNANSFIIASAGKALTLDNSGNGAVVDVTGGTANAIQTALALNDNVTMTISASNSLSISGVITNVSNNEALTVNGPGTLSLSGNNSYGPSAGSTGTTLSGGGTVQAGNNNALGAGDVAVNGSCTLQAGAANLTLPNNFNYASGVTNIVNNAGNALTLSGAFNSSDSTPLIVFNGSGVVTLSGSSSFSGGMLVNQGVLSLPSASPVGGAGPITLNGGDLLGTGSFTVSGNIGIGRATGTAGTNAQIDAASGQALQLTGNLTSAGNTGTNGLLVNSHSGHTGAVILDGVNTFSGTTIIDNGTLQVQNAAALQDSTLFYNNQGGLLTFDSSLTAATLGALSGAQGLVLTNLSGAGVALTVGNNGASTLYSGSLADAGATSGNGSLTLAGGALTLSGPSVFSGATLINGGVLTNYGAMAVSAVTFANAASAEMVLAGGSLVATNSSYVGKPSLGLLVTGGSALFSGGLTTRSGQNYNGLIEVAGGSLTTASLALTRGTLAMTAQPAAGSTVDGLYVNGGAVTITGNLDMSSGNQESSVNARMDSGSLTVGGSVIIGLNNGGRWSVLDVNGGTLTVTNATTGIVVAGGEVGNGILLVRAGTATVGMIGLGNAGNADEAVVDVTGGSLYLGAGGITQVGTAVTNLIALGGGILGAATNWSCVLPITLAGPATIQAADAAGNAQSILLSGGLAGTGNLIKSGAGILTLANTNVYVGSTTVSNGDLQLIAPANLNGTNFTAFNLATTNSILDLTSAGAYAADGVTLLTNSTLYLTNQSQSLSGVGTIRGSLVASNGTTVTIGAPTGALTVTQRVELAGGLTMNLNRTNLPTASELISPVIGVDATATLTVANVGPAVQAGDVFRLFSAGYTGHFSDTNLPALTGGLIWSNTLASNGRLTVVQTESSNPTNITYSISGRTLSLSWPADHTGWTLQAQTNNLGTGLGTNWVSVSGSTATNTASISIDPAKPTVYFRLKY